MRPLSALKLYDIGSFGALALFDNVTAHRIAFREAFEAIALDRGKMGENIGPVFQGNETKPLGIIEPLYSSLCHDCILLS